MTVETLSVGEGLVATRMRARIRQLSLVFTQMFVKLFVLAEALAAVFVGTLLG